MKVYILIRSGIKSLTSVFNNYVLPGIEALRDEAMYDNYDIEFIEHRSQDELYEAYSYVEEQSIIDLKRRIMLSLDTINKCNVLYFGEICQLYIDTTSEDPREDANKILPIVESNARKFRRFILYAARSPLTEDALRGLQKECELKIDVIEADISAPIELLDVIHKDEDY